MSKGKQGHWTAAQASVELELWKASRMTLAEHCRRRGLSAKRLYWWRRRLEESGKGGAGDDGSGGTRWVEATITSVGGSPAVVVYVQGGTRIEVDEVERVGPTWVATLVRTLGLSG